MQGPVLRLPMNDTYRCMHRAGNRTEDDMARDPRDERLTNRDTVRDGDREQTVELREEELRASKERVKAGEIQIGKDVVTEEKTIDVPVMHEEVTIDRRAVDRRPADRPIGDSETIEVPVYEEQVDVDKQAVVYEEVSVGKRQIQETERVSGTVEREVIEAEGSGSLEGRGWDEISGAQREAWEKRFKGSGRRWEDAEPGYRYSHEMSNDPRYKGRGWDEVEPDLKADYAQRARTSDARTGNEDAWEGLRQDAREAWEQTHRR